MLFLPALLELLTVVAGEGGMFTRLLGGAGMGEGLAGQAAKGGVTKLAAEKGEQEGVSKIGQHVLSPNASKLLNQGTDALMRQWFPKTGQGSAQQAMGSIGQQIHAGGSGGGNKPPSSAAVSTPTPAPNNPNQTPNTQQQTKQNQLQQQSLQQQQKAVQLGQQWLPTLQKWLFTANNLIFAFQNLKSAVTGNSGSDRRSFFKFGLDVLKNPITETSKFFYNVYKSLIKVDLGLLNFARGISESNRELSNWNGSLAASFGRLDFQKQKLQIQQGAATSGSGVLLNEKLGELLTELQPLTNAVTSAVNIAAVGATYLARGLVFLAKLNPVVSALLGVLNGVEKELKNKPIVGPLGTARGGLRDLRDLGANRPGERPNDIIPGPRGNLPPLKIPK